MEKVCFTGYRPNKLPFTCRESDLRYAALKAKAEQLITQQIMSGKRYFLSGMAQGADMIFAEIIVRLKREYPDLFLECVLPFPQQIMGWSGDYKAKYRRILDSADLITTVNPVYSKNCYMQRNAYMVDAASLVIALYDGQKGGTKNTVDYAVKSGREIIVLNPGSLHTIHIKMPAQQSFLPADI